MEVGQVVKSRFKLARLLFPPPVTYEILIFNTLLPCVNNVCLKEIEKYIAAVKYRRQFY